MLHFEIHGYNDSDTDVTYELVANAFKDAPYAGRILLSKISSRTVDLVAYFKDSVLKERVVRVYGHKPDLAECSENMMARFKRLRAIIEVVELQLAS